MLLPALVGVVEKDPKAVLPRLLVVGSITSSNCAEFERDNKSVKETWRKRGKKIAASKLAGQVRLSLNNKERVKENLTTQNLSAEVDQIQLIWEQEEHRIPFDYVDKRSERSDKGHKRPKTEPRRDLPAHLTDRDKVRLATDLKSASQALAADEEEDHNELCLKIPPDLFKMVDPVI